jgi:hypothetical protein
MENKFALFLNKEQLELLVEILEENSDNGNSLGNTPCSDLWSSIWAEADKALTEAKEARSPSKTMSLRDAFEAQKAENEELKKTFDKMQSYWINKSMKKFTNSLDNYTQMEGLEEGGYIAPFSANKGLQPQIDVLD